jgi:hypothetical protein
MKKLALVTAATLLGFSSVALADAVTQPKQTKSQGNCVGFESSSFTGNGGAIGGNGGLQDQTTFPGSRAEAVHAAQNSPNCQGLRPN